MACVCCWVVQTMATLLLWFNIGVPISGGGGAIS